MRTRRIPTTAGHRSERSTTDRTAGGCPPRRRVLRTALVALGGLALLQTPAGASTTSAVPEAYIDLMVIADPAGAGGRVVITGCYGDADLTRPDGTRTEPTSATFALTAAGPDGRPLITHRPDPTRRCPTPGFGHLSWIDTSESWSDKGASNQDRSLILPPGDHRVCVNVPDATPVGAAPAPRVEICRTLKVTAGYTAPVGNLETVRLSPGGMRITGWGVALDGPGSTQVRVAYRDGGSTRWYTASIRRPDVAASFPGRLDRFGFSVDVPSGPGCIEITDPVYSGLTTTLGCTDLPEDRSPVGRIDSLTINEDRSVNLSGWMVDPDTTFPGEVRLFVDGAMVAALPTGGRRDDLPEVFALSRASAGFSGRIAVGVPTEARLLCAVGGNVGFGFRDTILGCTQLTVK